jgi:hypothetical protein
VRLARICKGLRLGSYRTGILELYSIEKRTTGCLGAEGYSATARINLRPRFRGLVSALFRRVCSWTVRLCTWPRYYRGFIHWAPAYHITPLLPSFRGYPSGNLLVSVLLRLSILLYTPPINLGLLYFLSTVSIYVYSVTVALLRSPLLPTRPYY